MIEYSDGSVLAQICATDMRMPIQYALTYPDRCDAPVPKIELGGSAAVGIPAARFRQVPSAETGLPVPGNRRIRHLHTECGG